jgi:hypothetical protein
VKALRRKDTEGPELSSPVASEKAVSVVFDERETALIGQRRDHV